MYRKYEKYSRNYSPFHVRLKNFGELWSTKNNVPVAHIDNPSGYPSGDYISEGVLRPKIFKRARN